MWTESSVNPANLINIYNTIQYDIGHIPKAIKCLENEFRSHYLDTT